MRRGVAGTLALLALAPAAQAQQRSARGIAAALQQDPVYVAPARRGQIDAAAAGRLRLQIVREDIGRVKVAVVPGSWAPGASAARALANAVDRELGGARGALLLVADGAAHVVTSHDSTAAAVREVRRAFRRGDSLEQRLQLAVRGLAELDPGPSGDADPRGMQTSPATGASPDLDFSAGEEITDTVNDGLRWAFIAVIAAVAGVFLLVAFVFWRQFRIAREEREDVAEDLAAAIEEERAQLGEDIVDLDVPTGMPGADLGARAAYERALDAYEKSALALQRADTHRRLEAVRRLVADGRADAARARAAVGR